MSNKLGKPVSQRQLRVGEMIKQSLGMIFVKNEAKVPIETNGITVTEVKMSQDLKIAKAYVMPLGGKDADEVIKKYDATPCSSVEEVLEKANIAANKGEDLTISWQQFKTIKTDAKEKVQAVSLLLRKRQEKLLGHLIRAEINEPMRMVSITQTLERPQELYKRVGIPS